jgi:hypothetical protein
MPNVKPRPGGKSKPKPSAARRIKGQDAKSVIMRKTRARLKEMQAAKTRKAGEAQRRGMAATRATQQKGRLTADARRKVTQRDKQKRLDDMYEVTKRKFWE